MEAAPAVFAVDEKVLVGDNQHQAYVARPVREGDDTVLVRWESTKKEEEVAVGDVKKIDLEAKRPRRKRRDASAAETEASAPAQREPPRKRRKKKALPSAHESLHEEIERRESPAVRRRLPQEVGCRSAGIARQKTPTAPIAPRLAAPLRTLALRPERGRGGVGETHGRWHQTAARTAAITEAGGIPPLVALVRTSRPTGRRGSARATRRQQRRQPGCGRQGRRH